MDAEELVAWGSKVVEEALFRWSTSGDRVAAAKDMLDATIVSMLFGHLPTPRVTCVINTTTPSYEGDCL